MSEMVERVAREFAAEFMHLTARQRKSFKFPDDANGDTIDRAMSSARRAIEAMREPIEAMREPMEAMREPMEAMVQAGYTADNGEDRNLGEKGARECWALMIDEALK